MDNGKVVSGKFGELHLSGDRGQTWERVGPLQKPIPKNPPKDLTHLIPRYMFQTDTLDMVEPPSKESERIRAEIAKDRKAEHTRRMNNQNRDRNLHRKRRNKAKQAKKARKKKK